MARERLRFVDAKVYINRVGRPNESRIALVVSCTDEMVARNSIKGEESAEDVECAAVNRLNAATYDEGNASVGDASVDITFEQMETASAKSDIAWWSAWPLRSTLRVLEWTARTMS